MNGNTVKTCDANSCDFSGGPYKDDTQYTVRYRSKTGDIQVKQGDILKKILENPVPMCFSNDCDNDGKPNSQDNCPAVANPDQADSEIIPLDCHMVAGKPVCPLQKGDGIGDACDNCWNVDSKDQIDSDHDCESFYKDWNYCNGVRWIKDPQCGDACDRCPGFDDSKDADHDGVPDECDNCPIVYNPDQKDTDKDGIGDACDCNDGIKGPNEAGIDCGGECLPQCIQNPPQGIIKVKGRILYEDIYKDINDNDKSYFKPVRLGHFYLWGCEDVLCNTVKGSRIILTSFTTENDGSFVLIIKPGIIKTVYVAMGKPSDSYWINYATVIAHDLDDSNEYVWWTSTDKTQYPLVLTQNQVLNM